MQASSPPQGASPRNPKRAAKIVGMIFLGISLIPLAVGLFFLIDTLQFLSSATATATGVIVSCPRPKSSSTACTATVAFTTAQGQSVTITTSFASSAFEVGQQQPVAYNPDHPQDARISSFLVLWFVPTLLLGLGGLFFLIGAIASTISYFARRKAQGA